MLRHLETFHLRKTAGDGYRHHALKRWRDILAWLAATGERARQRRALSRMSKEQLQDIGLTLDDIDGEIHKPFWRR
ncbi:MAG: DUF1127 domain-containing protein [Dongiaceae bacterium]